MTQHGTPISQTAWPMPRRAVMQGESVLLDPLGLHHCDDLWEQASVHPDSFNYLRYGPFAHKDALHDVISDLSSRADQPFWAVRPNGGPALGWLSICDIDTANGSIEIGSIWFSPVLQGTRAAREAVSLAMCHCMDDLGYERLVWRCQAENARSMRAAQNLGFQHEGTWRNAAVVKGWQRGVAWFSILKSEWPERRAALSGWLDADNFDDAGQQRSPLRHN